eukprot:6416065-Ditylum_brightwellii.AAC.1
MPNNVFKILPKIEGFSTKLNYGEDYKIHYNTECVAFPTLRTQYLYRYLFVLKSHYKEYHVDLVENNNLLLPLESYIYYHHMLNKRDIPKHSNVDYEEGKPEGKC